MSPDGFDLSAFKRPPRPTTGHAASQEPAEAPDEPRHASAHPKTRQAPQGPPEQPQRGLQATPAASAAQPGAPVRRRRPPRSPGPASDGRLVLALPIALRDRARAVAAGRGETYADVVLRAVQNTHDRLPALIAAHQDTDTAPAIGDLFEHRPRTRRTPEATTQVTIRGLSPHDRDVLERLVDHTGARTLTELVTVALDEDLPQRPRAIR